MINTLLERIKLCKSSIDYYETKVPSDDSEKMYNKGMLDGFKFHLNTLQELLVTAQKLEELSESA